MDRFREPPAKGVLCDLLWADPIEEIPENENKAFESNTIRGCSWYFGYEAADRFLSGNNLLTIIRAHEVEEEGYRMYRTRESTGFPSVVTVFSAPNFNDTWNNQACVIQLVDNQFNLRKFKVHSPVFILLCIFILLWDKTVCSSIARYIEIYV